MLKGCHFVGFDSLFYKTAIVYMIIGDLLINSDPKEFTITNLQIIIKKKGDY